MVLTPPDCFSLRLGIIRSSSIGDVILATSCYQLLKNLGRPFELIWIGRPPSLDLVKNGTHNVHTISLDQYTSLDMLVDELKSVMFLVDLQNNLRSRLLCFKFKSKYSRPYYTMKKHQWLRSQLILTARFRNRSKPIQEKALHPTFVQHEMMSNALKRALSIELPAYHLDQVNSQRPRPLLEFSADSASPLWMKELQHGKWLAIAPGASFATKRAPVEIFSKIISHLKESFPHPFGLLFLGDHEDSKASQEIIDHIVWPYPMLNLSGKLSLVEVGKALMHVKGFLGNDSALSHLSESVGTPAAVLFGPTVEGFGFTPHMAKSSAFSAPLGCRPCSKHGNAPCRFNDLLCFHSISIERVVSKLRDFLE